MTFPIETIIKCLKQILSSIPVGLYKIYVVLAVTIDYKILANFELNQKYIFEAIVLTHHTDVEISKIDSEILKM